MTWDKLVDRCLLFTDAPGGLLRELLKEAETELSNQIQLYESIFQLEVPATDYGLGLLSHQSAASHEYHKLPQDYLRDIYVSHEGRQLRKMTEDELYRRTNGTVPTGTPTAYGISGDYIVFNQVPSAGDKFYIYYKSRLTDAHTEKVAYMHYYKAASTFVWLDTILGASLDNKKILFEGQAKTISSGTTTSLFMPPGVPDIWNKSMPGDPSANASLSEIIGSKYTISAFSGTGSLSGSTTDGNGGLCTIQGYRTVAPLIADEFHTDLCNYAIALANAKSAPNTYATYWALWEAKIKTLIDEASDRDLIHSIKEEI